VSNTGKLFFMSGELAGSEIELESGVSVALGRNPEACQIVLKSDRISRIHCTIMFDAHKGKLMLTNHSEQGVTIDNVHKLSQGNTVYLDNGSTIRLGHSDIAIRYTYEETSGEQASDGDANINASGNNDVFYEYFVDSSEQLVMTLKNSMVLRFFTLEGLTKNQVVLTNKRLYYSYRNGLISDNSSRSNIDIEDITGTLIIRNNPLLLLVLAVIVLLYSIICACTMNMGIIFLYGFLTSVAVVVSYIKAKGNYMAVLYAGGKIKLKVKTYSTKELLDFQKAIHALKDKRKQN